MILLLVMAALVGIGSLAVNAGSKVKVSFPRIAVLMVLVCLVAYVVSLFLAPVLTQLLQLSQHL